MAEPADPVMAVIVLEVVVVRQVGAFQMDVVVWALQAHGVRAAVVQVLVADTTPETVAVVAVVTTVAVVAATAVETLAVAVDPATLEVLQAGLPQEVNVLAMDR